MTMTSTTTAAAQRPIATSTSTPSQITRMSILQNPVVRAMISNNRLTSCKDVSAMVRDCHASGSGDRICRTAAQYLDICIESGEWHQDQ
jgi:hypothetical protein